MYKILLVATMVLCTIHATTAGLIASAPLVYSNAGSSLGLDHVDSAIAVKHVGATSYANSNLIAVHPSLVQVAHAAAPVAVHAVQAAPLVVSGHHGLGLGGLYGH